MIHWKPFIYQDKIYNLAHLNPFSLEVIQEAKQGRPCRIYTFNVSFSLHCFTRRDAENTDNLTYDDTREKRFFCFRRYELSKSLPEIIKNIASKKCYHTGHNNYFLIEIIHQASNEKEEYEIYFKISKTNKKADMNLFIESAYIRDDAHKNTPKRSKKPIKFEILAYNTFHKKNIKVPK